MLCFLFIITIDYARLFYYSLTLKNACRNGAYYASNYPGLYSYQTASDATNADLSNLSPAPTVTIRYAASSTGPFNSTAVIPNGYVEVKAEWTFHSITHYPGVPEHVDLVRTCRMKVAPVLPSF